MKQMMKSSTRYQLTAVEIISDDSVCFSRHHENVTLLHQFPRQLNKSKIKLYRKLQINSNFRASIKIEVPEYSSNLGHTTISGEISVCK